jgi:hypothetical protein
MNKGKHQNADAHCPLKPASQILLELFDGSEDRLAEFMLCHTYFIDPAKVRKWVEAKGTAAVFPQYVRGSREHHPRKQRGDSSSWNNKEVRVWDNTKARQAFRRLTGLMLGGNVSGRVRGYHVAHIWERVHDPDFFTAGWNLCLLPGFLKLFTEAQDRVPLLHRVIQQAAYDLYFRQPSAELPRPGFVSDPGLDMAVLFPKWKPNLV